MRVNPPNGNKQASLFPNYTQDKTKKSQNKIDCELNAIRKCNNSYLPRSHNGTTAHNTISNKLKPFSMSNNKHCKRIWVNGAKYHKCILSIFWFDSNSRIYILLPPHIYTLLYNTTLLKATGESLRLTNMDTKEGRAIFTFYFPLFCKLFYWIIDSFDMWHAVLCFDRIASEIESWITSQQQTCYGRLSLRGCWKITRIPLIGCTFIWDIFSNLEIHETVIKENCSIIIMRFKRSSI